MCSSERGMNSPFFGWAMADLINSVCTVYMAYDIIISTGVLDKVVSARACAR
jgi:hypothetical protein